MNFLMRLCFSLICISSFSYCGGLPLPATQSEEPTSSCMDQCVQLIGVASAVMDIASIMQVAHELQTSQDDPTHILTNAFTYEVAMYSATSLGSYAYLRWRQSQRQRRRTISIQDFGTTQPSRSTCWAWLRFLTLQKND